MLLEKERKAIKEKVRKIAEESARKKKLSEEKALKRRIAEEKERKKKAASPSMQVVQPTQAAVKVDALFELEKQIITLLMLYGHREEQFKESVLEFSEEENEVEEKSHEVTAKVFEKIFLDLQQM